MVSGSPAGIHSFLDRGIRLCLEALGVLSHAHCPAGDCRLIEFARQAGMSMPANHSNLPKAGRFQFGEPEPIRRRAWSWVGDGGKRARDGPRRRVSHGWL